MVSSVAWDTLSACKLTLTEELFGWIPGLSQIHVINGLTFVWELTAPFGVLKRYPLTAWCFHRAEVAKETFLHQVVPTSWAQVFRYKGVKAWTLGTGRPRCRAYLCYFMLLVIESKPHIYYILSLTFLWWIRIRLSYSDGPELVPQAGLELEVLPSQTP